MRERRKEVDSRDFSQLAVIVFEFLFVAAKHGRVITAKLDRPSVWVT
jgi:hypothetical protein